MGWRLPGAVVVVGLLLAGCTENPAFNMTASSLPGETQPGTTTLAELPTGDPTEDGTTEADATTIVSTTMAATLPGSTSTTDNDDSTTTSTSSDASTSEPTPSTGDPAEVLQLEAIKYYGPSMNEDGNLVVDPPLTVAIPAQLEVLVGNAGDHKALLRLDRGEMPSIHCYYYGGSDQSKPMYPSDQFDKGLVYNLENCDEGLTAGDPVTVDHLHLRVDNGHSEWPERTPQTKILATLPVL